MTRTRVARCGCGQLSATCLDEPVRVSVCHCHWCQRRTGGPFAAQARFPADAVTIAGEGLTWERVGEGGRRAWFRRCVACGSMVTYTNEGMEDTVAIPLGAFTGDDMPRPTISVFENRKQSWVEIVGTDIEHD